VFPCGAENGLEIHDALRYSVHVDIHGASSVDDHGRFTFASYQGGLPKIDSPDFLPAFVELLHRWHIDLVFATHDTVCTFLAEHATILPCAVVNDDVATTRTARRKSLTYRHFDGQPWIPRVYPSVDAVTEWPIVVKPDCGQGGQGVTIVRSREQAVAAMSQMTDPLLVEFLPGDEVTVDCFTDRHGRLVFAGARTRERVRAGIAMRSHMLDADVEIQRIGEAINTGMTLHGPWFFQLRRDRDGRWKLLEFACRVAGAMVTHRAQGVNIPLLTVLDHRGLDVVAAAEPRITLVDRRISSRADIAFDFSDVFIDFDDTLVIDGKVVPSAVSFVYRMIARGKRIVLLTRHAYDLDATLKSVRLSRLVFDEVIHITDGSPKSAHMHADAIFVDNHFPERADARKVLGIPAFDVDALEFFDR
jgi:hypothetical protein